MMKNIIVGLCCLTLLFSSCKTASVATEKQALAHNWVLIEGGKDQMGCNVSKPVSISFTEKGVNGYSGCNNYFGPFKVRKKRSIKLGPLASTMMACVGKDCGKVEVGFIRKLDQVNKYKLMGNSLFLYMDSQLLLSFRNAD